MYSSFMEAREIIRAGAVSGIIGFIIFFVFSTTAMTLIPGYNFFTQFFSELGLQGLAAEFFNSGLILSGLLFVVFFLGLNEYFKTFLKKAKEPLIAKIGIVLGVAASISLAGTGLFPATDSFSHMIPTASFFIFAGFSVVLLSVYLYSLRKKMIYIFPGIAVILIDIVFALYTIPIIQKIAVFAIALWFLAMAVRMIIDSR